ncbi:MAG TPA: RNA-binding protein [Puia sp.]|nr:RNA-binding protein [Puia sp.]
MNIYVANLSFDIRDEDLKELFAPYGEVSSAKVIMDKVTSRSRGFGFVEMSDDAAAQKAITELDKTTVQNRQINVNEAKPKEEKSYGGGGSSRGGNSGGGGYNNSSSYNNTRY